VHLFQIFDPRPRHPTGFVCTTFKVPSYASGQIRLTYSEIVITTGQNLSTISLDKELLEEESYSEKRICT